MLRLVIRPLLVILTLGMLLVALFQVTGRIAMALLDDLELSVNQVLSGRAIRITGLEGDWRMLNPVLRAQRVDLPAGHLEDVVLELDMVESVLRGRPLARRLRIADLELALVKEPGRAWRLSGAGEPADVDPWPFLRHSSQLEVAGRLEFRREGMDPAGVGFTYLGTNRGGEHRHALEVANAAADCRGDCRLELEYHGQDELWPLRPGRARLEAASRGFLLPRPVLGISPVAIRELAADWQKQDGASAGALRLRAEQLDMPGDVTLSTRLEGAMRGRDGVHSGALTEWQVARGDEVWELPQVSVRADDERVTLWMPSLDLARAGAFLRQALAAVGPAERWLGALDVRGQAHNLRAAYELEGAGLAYAMSIDGLGITGYKGVPTVQGGSGELFGYGRGLQFNINAQDLGLAFPDVFTGEWELPYAQGSLQAWFSPGYFGIRGLNLRGEALGARAAGGFAMSRPPDREGQRLLLLLSTDRIGVAEAQQFVPYKLPGELENWLLTAPEAGILEDARLAYQGQFQEQPGELARRVALTSTLRNGRVRYQEAWPAVTDLDGALAVSGSLVEVDVLRGSSAGARIDGSRVRVVDNAAAANVSLDAEADGGDVLEFIRTTPLSGWLGFVEPDWQSNGPLRLSGELSVPIGDDSRELGVRLRSDLDGVDLDLPGYRMALDDLEGSFRYRYPYEVDADGVQGRLFGEPVTIAARTGAAGTGGAGADGAEPERVHLRFVGRAAPADVWRVAQIPDLGVAEGTFEFEADLGIAVTEGAVSDLDVVSDLEGLALDLPADYGKPAELPVVAEARLEFHPEHNLLEFLYRDARGWLHVDDRIRRGAVGFAVAPTEEDPALEQVVLSGVVGAVELEEVLPGGGLVPAADERAAAAPDGDPAPDGGATPGVPLRLAGLSVSRIGVGDFAVHDARLNGEIGADGFEVRIDSNEVAGVMAQDGTAPMTLGFERVRVPADEEATTGGEAAADPLDPSVIAELPVASVRIDQLTLGDENYGSWSFSLRPEANELIVESLRAAVRGVEVQASEPMIWRGDTNETRFVGSLTGGNLAVVLPQWGYAPSVETDSATLAGSFTWTGSPLAVDLLKLRGRADVDAQDGRFLDVESGAGAQRIFSLLNFTAIAKRMALNFGDVFGRGISFDDLDAVIAFDEGLLSFVEPMEVEGTGSSFRVTGTVDLDSGQLDNDMLVTLPVSRSLPWYAAYVALANPLAGVGLLVGERVLRKPLEQFSSARYHIGGTLEDPDVNFVSVFDVEAPEGENAEGATKAGGDDAPAAAPTPTTGAADETPDTNDSEARRSE